MVVKGYRVGAIVRGVGREVMDDNVLGLAAQTAYYFFFSLFPLLLFVAPLLGLVGEREQTMGYILDQLSQSVPASAMTWIEDVVRGVVFTDGAPGLMSVGALLALWAGSNVFNALAGALNRAYDAEETRPWWKTRLMAIAMVIISGVVVLTATITILAGQEIIDWVGTRLGLPAATRAALIVAQYAIALLSIVALLWVTYLLLPCVKQSKRQVLVGAVVATVLWLIVTFGFRFYVANFGNYDKTYGTIGGVIVLLTWMYLTMLVLLVGGEINSELHKGTGSVKERAGHLFGGRVSSGGEAVATPSV
ncbi:MAG TPA: YihY/virulence factor BrkB family protein, partial [Gemmatimonadales bacterium]